MLVVDDNATNRRILVEMLTSWHMAPSAVADARSALHAASEGRGDAEALSRSDFRLPDARRGRLHADPLDSARCAPARSAVHHADVDRSREGAAHGCARRGITAALTKPVKHSDLLDTFASLFAVVTRRETPRGRRHAGRPGRRAACRSSLAEDHAVNRKLVTTLLKKRGHAVEAVEHGGAAMEALEAARSPFDVVIMDLQMPEMGGLEATAAHSRARSRPARHVPIVALTAHAMKGDRERCLAAGMDGYLSKPIDVNLLLATVEHIDKTALSSSSAAGPASAPAAVAARPREGARPYGRRSPAAEGTRRAVPRGCAGVAAQDRARRSCERRPRVA